MKFEVFDVLPTVVFNVDEEGIGMLENVGGASKCIEEWDWSVILLVGGVFLGELLSISSGDVPLRILATEEDEGLFWGAFSSLLHGFLVCVSRCCLRDGDVFWIPAESIVPNKGAKC